MTNIEIMNVILTSTIDSVGKVEAWKTYLNFAENSGIRVTVGLLGFLFFATVCVITGMLLEYKKRR